MIKQILTQMNLSYFAEAALVLFAIVFVAIAVRTLLSSTAVAEQQSRIVLDEQPEHDA